MTYSGAVASGDTGVGSGENRMDVRLTAQVDDVLRTFLRVRRAAADLVDPTYGEAVGALAEFVLRGGKRIRPVFTWWGWRGAGGDPETEPALAVLRAASALELIQAGALIHDDLMDASTTRRGHPSVHVDFACRHHAAGWQGDASRFGAAAAVLLGDVALVWADDMLRAAGLPPAAADRVTPVWEAMRTEVLGGQFLDVLGQASGDVSPESALRISRYKTAAYTIERPLQLGAAIAGVDDTLVAAYRRFGADLGVAFQLRDDLLGVFGDPEVTGKPAGDDLREGKRTLLVALALREADRRGAWAAGETIRGALGAEGLEAHRLADVRTAFQQLGAVAAVEHRIEELTASALDALSAAPVVEPAATRLAELAVHVTRRDR
jgi:geranylgeranyl diphosphate synthase type I